MLLLYNSLLFDALFRDKETTTKKHTKRVFMLKKKALSTANYYDPTNPLLVALRWLKFGVLINYMI